MAGGRQRGFSAYFADTVFCSLLKAILFVFLNLKNVIFYI